MQQKFEAQRTGASQALKEQQNGRFVDKKSHKLVAQTQRNALSEIFDVLLVTAEMQRERHTPNAHQCDTGSDKVPEEAAKTDASPSDTPIVTTAPLKDMLDTSLAQARFLQPKQLSDAIGVVLSALSPRTVSRKQFVEFTLHCMNKTYIIEQPSRARASSQAPPTVAVVASPATDSASTPTVVSTPPRSPSVAVAIDVESVAPAVPLSAPVQVSTADLHPEGSAATESAQYYNNEPYSPVSNSRSRSRASSPAHTPRANRASQLRTGLLASSAPSPSARPLTPNRANRHTHAQSSNYAAMDRDEPSGHSSNNHGHGVYEDGDSAPVIVPAASIPVMIPPIGYLLVAASTGGSGTASQREREEGTQAQREYRTHFTGKPHLVAAKTTEKLAKQRYPHRVKGQQKVEDSLIACKCYFSTATLIVCMAAYVLFFSFSFYLPYRIKN
jgi:hypothetical protein